MKGGDFRYRVSENESGSREVVKVIAAPNNGMHPTPLHGASHASCVGARVMPGVRRLWLFERGCSSMLRNLSTLLLLLACGTVLAQSPAKPVAKSCRARPDLVGKCFTVRGRLSVYNGTPSIRLWPIGSKRLLGVLDPEGSSGELGPSTIPATIKGQLDWDKEIFGDFLVCPLTRARPGRMRTVCIESGKNLIARERQ